jgi:hypothetical protein
MKSPPKEERGLQAALKTAELLVAYRLLSFLQAPFAEIFWLIEQRKSRLQDRMANGSSGHE